MVSSYSIPRCVKKKGIIRIHTKVNIIFICCISDNKPSCFQVAYYAFEQCSELPQLFFLMSMYFIMFYTFIKVLLSEYEEKPISLTTSNREH